MKIYELICNIDESLTTLIRKSIKREVKISAKEFFILIYFKIRSSRYKKEFSRKLKRVKDKQLADSVFVAVEQALYKKYGNLEELAEMLKRMTNEF